MMEPSNFPYNERANINPLEVPEILEVIFKYFSNESLITMSKFSGKFEAVVEKTFERRLRYKFKDKFIKAVRSFT